MQGKYGAILGCVLVFLCMMTVGVVQTAPLGTAFTYQGRLTDNGLPADAVYDFQFRLFDALSGGNQVGVAVIRENIAVTKGLFTVADLDFGSGIFNGETRWLEIGVRIGGDTGSFTVLSPLQAMTATPYALYAANTPTGAGGRGIATVNAGAGLTGGGSNLSVTLDVGQGPGILVDSNMVSADTSYLQRRVTGTCLGTQAIQVVNSDGTVSCSSTGDSPWKYNGTSIYYLDGNMGLGTNNPGYPLEIRDFGSSQAHQYTLSVESDSPWTIFGNNWNNSASSLGVYGGTHSQAAGAAGVWGCVSTAPSSADGVLGTTNGSGAGVKGTNYSSNGYGVYGQNTSTYGGIGVYGTTDSNAGYGVKGSAPGGASGVFGTCSGYGNGVYGYNSANGPGIRGFSIASNGVWGETSSNNSIDAGVYGKANNAGYGVYSQGHFGCSGDSYISGNLYLSGSKSAVVATSQGNKKLYSQESPEVWFEDFGEGELEGGMASIDLDPLFLETVTIDEHNPLKVFIQLNDDCNGVYVQRRATGFEVKELKGGTSRAQFTYRVVAKRKGFETARLESAGDNPKLAD
jgi:hypothetical protein